MKQFFLSFIFKCKCKWWKLPHNDHYTENVTENSENFNSGWYCYSMSNRITGHTHTHTHTVIFYVTFIGCVQQYCNKHAHNSAGFLTDVTYKTWTTILVWTAVPHLQNILNFQHPIRLQAHINRQQHCALYMVILRPKNTMCISKNGLKMR